ncbi:MAG: hypothetical protein V1688_00200 [bacterium]
MIKYLRKISTPIFILIFLLSFASLTNVNIAKADMWDGMAKQMGALAEKSGYSSDGVPAASIEEIVASTIQYLLSFLGVIFICLIIYAGFLWMTASGDSEQITKAKGILINAIIGVIIVLSAYIITSYIFTRLGSATGTGQI